MGKQHPGGARCGVEAAPKPSALLHSPFSSRLQDWLFKRGKKQYAMAGRLAAAFLRGEDYGSLHGFCFLASLESRAAFQNPSGLSKRVCTPAKRGRVAFAEN